ncbi:MAG: hypothetical protein IKB59_00845, partial [Alphaproteobacteria bacterium]|nr:hypothetical protein [Alphaproteobacteria bacterium]
KGMPTMEIHEKDAQDIFWLTTYAYTLCGDRLDPDFEKYISSPNHLAKRLYKLKSDKLWFKILEDIAISLDNSPALPGPVTYDLQKEYQKEDILHRVVMENNGYAEFNATDYFIIDVEHTQPDNQNTEKLKAVAIHWPETIKTNQNAPLRLAFIEFKAGKDSVDTIDFPQLNDKDFNDIEKAIAQMCKLYLISVPGVNDVATLDHFKIDRTKTQKIVVPVNCNQFQEMLLKKIDNINVPDGVDFRIATSRFMGYGLYDDNMLTPAEFKKMFTKNIKE